jgi:hypothetical protein
MFVAIWTYRLRDLDDAAEFEKHYSVHGTWAAFFRQGSAYHRTALLRDVDDPLVYTTFDFWSSAEAYDAFIAEHLDEYKRIDRLCAGLTQDERCLGRMNVP